jgi:diphthine-ammonia ligase
LYPAVRTDIIPKEESLQVKAAVLYSGGKDSNRALHWALEKGFDVEYLVTMFPKTMDSLMFHTPALNLVELQSCAVDIPLIKGKVNGVRVEEEVDALKNTLSSLDVECLVSGALESQYQRSRVDLICKSLRLRSFAPFWHTDLEQHLKQTIDLGFDVRFVGVAALGLDETWLGRRLDYDVFEQLRELKRRYQVNIAGEGGEFETTVCDGPIFKQRIVISKSKKIWDKKTGSGYLQVEEARLVSCIDGKTTHSSVFRAP